MSDQNQEHAHTKFVANLVQDKCDPKLGAAVYKHLIGLGLDVDRVHYDPAHSYGQLVGGMTYGLNSLGMDIENDPSTRDTPKRFACMFIGELTKGLNYDFFPKCTAQPNGATSYRREADRDGAKDVPYTVGAYNQMVLVKDIQSISLCEHHLQTIDGVVHIAYIPKAKVLGLSKFARVTEFFSRRPQIQERMTEQITAALAFILQTDDIGVVVDATHFCMRARGAMQSQARTRTDCMKGRFLTNPALRQEMFDAIR